MGLSPDPALFTRQLGCRSGRWGHSGDTKPATVSALGSAEPVRTPWGAALTLLGAPSSSHARSWAEMGASSSLCAGGALPGSLGSSGRVRGSHPSLYFYMTGPLNQWGALQAGPAFFIMALGIDVKSLRRVNPFNPHGL